MRIAKALKKEKGLKKRISLAPRADIPACSTFSPHVGGFLCDKVEGDALSLINMRAQGYGAQKAIIRASGVFQVRRLPRCHVATLPRTPCRRLAT